MLKGLFKLWWKIRFRDPQDLIVVLGKLAENGSLAVLYHYSIWKELTFIQKIKATFSEEWPPKEFDHSTMAHEVFLDEVFGGRGIVPLLLFDIAQQRETLHTEFNFLTESDLDKARGINASAHMLFRKYKPIHSNPRFDIEIGDDHFFQELLINISSKFPIYNIRYFLHVNVFFAFDEIRRLKIDKDDELIDALYDLLYIQQKISSSLFECVNMMAKIQSDKVNQKNTYLIYEQIKLGKELESIIVMQKATIEKMIALLSLVYSSQANNEVKRNDSRLKKLDQNIPEEWKNSEYYKFLFDHLKREGYADLEELRTKILHWVGDERLQPHYYSKRTSEENLHFNLEIYGEVMKFHHLNTLALISSLALITDKLMSLESEEMFKKRRMETTELFINSIRFDKLKLAIENADKTKDETIDE